MTQKTKWLDLLINGDTRKAEAAKVNDLYVVMVPAANLVDASGSGQNNPAVQGHRAVFDKNGVLLGVDALGWNAEGGFYNTKWPSKADSVYNANAAKTYAPLVFQQMKRNGGGLTKFQDGGVTQPSQEQIMQELMQIVQKAATELQSNKPGEGVQTLAQLANDPQGSQLLDTLAQQVPEVGQIVEAVMLMVGAYKCGGKTKKKVKKGAKGCIPCKKLMRVGGKLVNVLTDCEGNIISKHQAGGWLIPKGDDGLLARRLALLDKSHNATWLGQLQGYTRKAAGPLYYQDGNNYYTRTAFLNTDGTYGWDDWRQISALPEGAVTGTKSDLEKTNAYIDAYGVQQLYYDGTGWKNAESYYDPNSKSVKWKILGDAAHTNFGQDDVVAGANWETGEISAADATAAGIDVNQFKNSLGRRGEYEASYSPLLGESKPSETDVTLGYINSLGGMNATVKHERQQRRKDRRKRRSEHRAHDSFARLSTKDSSSDNDVSVLTTALKLTNLNNIDTNYANLASHIAAAMKAKWANYNVGTPASAATSSSGTNDQRDVLKQGGWLTKFLDGGLVYPKAETMYFDPQTRSSLIITNKKLEGRLLPAGTIITQTTGERRKGFPPQIVESYVSNPANYIYERNIKYGVIPSQNDTVYTTRFVGLSMPQMSELAKIMFNNEYYKQ